jgi:MFS family permease
LKAIVLLAVAILVSMDRAPIAAILPLVAISGVGLSFHLSSLHTLSGDLVGADRRASAISVVSTGQRTVAAAGALASGVVIAFFGASWSFGVGAAALALAALVYRGVPEPRAREGRSSVSFVADTVEGLRIVGRVRMVAILLGLMVVVEIFGFSYMALLPALADRVLHVGATGLGGLSAAAGIGSIGGTLFLTAHGDRARKGPLFIGVLLAFGLLMGLLGVSGWYVLALVAAGGLGACASMVDALEWIMLQASVDDRLRGRVLGAWNVAIGFGWIGPLLLGAIADATDVGIAFAIAGSVLATTALLAAVASPRLRAA